MPRIISDDGMVAQVQQDDGSIINIASQQAPGTMDYLQSIQDIKPFSGPPTGVENLAQVGGLNPMNPADEDLLKRLNMGGMDSRAALMDIKNRQQAIQADREAAIANNEAKRLEQQGLDNEMASLGLPSQRKTYQPGMTGGDIVAPQPSAQAVATPSTAQPSRVSGGSESGFDKAFRDMEQGQVAAMIEGQKTGIKKAAEFDAASKYLQEQQLQEQELQKARQDQIQSRLADYDKSMSEYQKMGIKNPWADASTGSKIGASLALILGAVGAGIAGQENKAMQVIDKAIQQDIDIQMKNIDKKGNEAGQKLNYLNTLRQTFSDDDSRRQALRTMYIDSIDNRLKGIEAAGASAEVSGKIQQLRGELGLKKEEARLKIMDNLASIAEKTVKANSGGADIKNFVPGLGYAYDPQDAKELRTMKSDLESAMGGIDELNSLISKPGKSLSIEDRARAETIQSTLIGKLRVALTGPGAMSEGDRALLEKSIRNPTSFFSLDASNKEALKTLKQTLQRTIEANAQNKIIGYQPGAASVGLSPEQQAGKTWLQQNPNDPRASEIKKRLGL